MIESPARGISVQPILELTPTVRDTDCMKSSVFRFYLAFSGLLLLFYLAFASCYALLQAWVKQVVGFTPQQIGTIYTLVAFVALFSAPLFGVLQDHLGTSKKLLIWLGVGMIICSPVMGYLFVFLAKISFIASAVLLALYLGIVMVGGVGTVESYCERASRHIGFEYGNARLWGSLGYAFSASTVGFFLEINPQICYYITSGAGILFILILVSLDTRQLQPDQERRYAERTNSLVQSLGLFKIPRFWMLTLFLFAASGGFMLFDQQFPNYFAKLFVTLPSDQLDAAKKIMEAAGEHFVGVGQVEHAKGLLLQSELQEGGGKKIAGILLAVQLCCDASVLLIMPWIVNRIGARNGLLLAGVIMACRMFGLGFVNEFFFSQPDQTHARIIMAGALKLVQAVDVPMLIVSTFKYIAPSFDSRYTSTVYLVSFQCSQQVCAVLLSTLMGFSYDHIGFEFTYMLMGIFIILMVVQALFTLPRLNSSQQGAAAHS